MVEQMYSYTENIRIKYLYPEIAMLVFWSFCMSINLHTYAHVHIDIKLYIYGMYILHTCNYDLYSMSTIEFFSISSRSYSIYL